jgi:uncharacterized protein YdeI (YjbR/CyaY-like superfamily)
MTPAPKHFAAAAAFRAWLERHHASERELWILFYKKASGKGGMTYREAVDEALCFGWIDGRVKSIDADSYMQRFTPRRPGSIWSNVNVRHIARLTAAGQMHPAGLAAFAARDEKKTGVYSFEKRPENFPADLEKIFRAKSKAWRFWQAQPPGYRRVITHWVISAKREETRQRRLATLIAESAAGRRIDFLKPPTAKLKRR